MKKKEVKRLSTKGLIDTVEAADILGITYKTAINWRSSGRGPKYYKTGDKRNSKVYYRKKDVQDYVKSQKDKVFLIETSDS